MKTARDFILELYKKNSITKEETDLLLDAINKTRTIKGKRDWTYDPKPF